MFTFSSDNDTLPAGHRIVLNGTAIGQLTEKDIDTLSEVKHFFELRELQHIIPVDISLNQGIFGKKETTALFPAVSVIQENEQLLLLCECHGEEAKLCAHQAEVLHAILKRGELRVFFDPELRQQKLKHFAADYGLENETDLEQYFEICYNLNKTIIKPKASNLLPVTRESLDKLRTAMDELHTDQVKNQAPGEQGITCIVLRRHKYDKHLLIDLYNAQATKDGKVKNPLNAVNPLESIWETEDAREIKFFTGISKFQSRTAAKTSAADIAALRAIIANPLQYGFYYHDADISENVSAASIQPVNVDVLPDTLHLTVTLKGLFYEIEGKINIDSKTHMLADLSLKYSYFLQLGNTLYLVGQLQALGIFELLKKTPGKLLVHVSKFKEFKSQFLNMLGDRIRIDYRHILPATPTQLAQQGFHDINEKILYLSDFGSQVMIIPVIRYGDVEIPILSKRQIYGVDDRGREFLVKRDEEAELAFISSLLQQHEELEPQLMYYLDYLCLPKKYFLDEEWFLKTFGEWRQADITVLGFDEIEGQKLNPEKVKIDIKVLSGINWFNAVVDVKFGKKKASLKKLQTAIRNKSKYVTLDDGTQGILPAEWLGKFADFFNAGEITEEDMLQISRINFSSLDQFDDEMLSGEVRLELKEYREKLVNFKSITEVEVPAGLNGTLRPYQREGLNWLNFLDEFNFGACLADDMGLGKSVQIIAFILSQRTKVDRNTNLIVVPATLVFNWQAEIRKFAPSIKVLVIYGSGRIKNIHELDQYEIVLTSYNTLLTDISFLKHYTFNYIILDESQNIKNPETQRYKAVRMLKSRNKIAVTGTPIENNTFDLYSQLSFACPGLLGSKHHFRDIYSLPIDTFKESRRAQELQDKIKPFMLRRTKQEVASDLPEKTEMVLFCEMKPEQRKIYDAYEKEFRDYISAANGDELKKNPMNVLKGLTRLRQICDSPALLGADAPLDHLTSSKIEMLMEQIEDKAPQHKMLVFSQFVSMLDLIKKELVSRNIPFAYLTGSTRNREAVVNEFQDNPDVRVFLISLKAGGTGLNLTEADCVFLVDPWWNPAVERQAIDRAHRIGQNKNVLAMRLICPGTVEEKMIYMQETKKDLADSLVQADTSFFKSLNKDDLLKMLS